MHIKERIIGACSECNDEGFMKDSEGVDCIPCSCLLKYRAYNRLSHGGFSVATLDFIASEAYKIPKIEEGIGFLHYFLENPFEVEKEGLGLYIFSGNRGKGKTTLTHKLMYEIVKEFFDKSVYLSSRDYAFENVEEFLAACNKNGFDNEELKWKKTWYVLDDLGNESRGYTSSKGGTANWKKEQVIGNLQRMLHYRRDHKLPLIITSNYNPEELSRIYEGLLDSLMEINTAGQLGGVLYRAVEVGGEGDLRFAKENSKWKI